MSNGRICGSKVSDSLSDSDEIISQVKRFRVGNSVDSLPITRYLVFDLSVVATQVAIPYAGAHETSRFLENSKPIIACGPRVGPRWTAETPSDPESRIPLGLDMSMMTG